MFPVSLRVVRTVDGMCSVAFMSSLAVAESVTFSSVDYIFTDLHGMPEHDIRLTIYIVAQSKNRYVSAISSSAAVGMFYFVF